MADESLPRSSASVMCNWARVRRAVSQREARALQVFGGRGLEGGIVLLGQVLQIGNAGVDLAQGIGLIGVDLGELAFFVGGSRAGGDAEGQAVKRDDAGDLMIELVVAQEVADGGDDDGFVGIEGDFFAAGNVEGESVAVRNLAGIFIELGQLLAFGDVLVDQEQNLIWIEGVRFERENKEKKEQLQNSERRVPAGGHDEPRAIA